MLKFLNFLNFTTTILIFLGFYYISFLPQLGFSNSVTIIMRGIVLLFCIITFIKFNNYKNLNIILLILFFSFYTFRLINDIFFLGLFLGKNPLEVLIFFFGVTLIPTLTLTNYNLKLVFIKYGKSFYYIFNILSFLMLFNNYFDESGRLSGNTVLNPITVSEIASCSILLNILFFYNLKKKLLITHFANIFFLIVNLLVMLLSASRGPLLGLITTVLFYLYYNKKIKIKTILIFLFIFIILYLFIINFSDKLGLVFLDRMVVNTGNGEKPQEERVLLWLEGIELFKNSIMLGSSTTTSLGYVHNFLIELLMSTGLIGLLIFIIPFKAALKNMFLHLKNNNIYLQWIGLLFLQFFINGLFSSMIWTNNYFFYFFGLMLTKPLTTNIQIKHQFYKK